MKKTTVTTIGLLLLVCTACARQKERVQAPTASDQPDQIRVRYEAEQTTDAEVNPWLVEATTLVATQNVPEDELPNDRPEIHFTSEPEPVPVPIPDDAPNRLQAGYVTDAQVQSNLQQSQYSGILAALESINVKLNQPVTASSGSDYSDQLDRIEAKIVGADEQRTIVSEELEKFGAKLKLEYKLVSGETKSTTINVDAAGVGTTSLPPGAVVTSMGGVPLAEGYAQNPGAIVKSGGSNGGSSGSVSLVPAATQYVAPMTSTYYETTSVPIAEQPVTASTDYYHSPGQFTTSSTSYPDETIVNVEVDQSYMPTTSSECYVDANGQQYCPQQVNTPAATPTRSGILPRLRTRFGR